MEFDLAVIGGGPAGYTAAEAAAHEGLSVVLFERDLLGGTCLNRGCIPTKALLHAAETWKAVQSAGEMGIHFEGATYDFATMHAHKTAVVDKLRAGIENLMKAGKVEVVSGAATIVSPGVITCNDQRFEATDIIVAAGSAPAIPPPHSWHAS